VSRGGKEKQMGGIEELPRANQVTRESKSERDMCDRTIALLLASLSVYGIDLTPLSTAPRLRSIISRETATRLACLP